MVFLLLFAVLIHNYTLSFATVSNHSIYLVYPHHVGTCNLFHCIIDPVKYFVSSEFESRAADRVPDSSDLQFFAALPSEPSDSN